MKLARLIAKTLVALAAILILGGIILFVLAVHVLTWPYRSTHGGNRRKGQIEALLALGTSLAALAAAFQAREDVKTYEAHKSGRAQQRKRDRELLRRWRRGHNTTTAEQAASDDVPF